MRIWSWQHVSVNIYSVAELSPVYCCLVSSGHSPMHGSREYHPDMHHKVNRGDYLRAALKSTKATTDAMYLQSKGMAFWRTRWQGDGQLCLPQGCHSWLFCLAANCSEISTSGLPPLSIWLLAAIHVEEDLHIVLSNVQFLSFWQLGIASCQLFAKLQTEELFCSLSMAVIEEGDT